MSWDRLSMAEKAEVMRLAVEDGIYDLDAIRNGYNEYAKGGKIHIKPENRGKFTALKKRTGHSAPWFKQHGTPAQKKMATFALNAGKWKHGLGGNLFGEGGDENPAFTPIENPVIPSVGEDQQAVDWLADWYNNRRKQLYNNMVSYGDAKKTFLYNIKDILSGNPEGRLAINHAYYDKLNNTKDFESVPFENLRHDSLHDYEAIAKENADYYGYTLPTTHRIYYNNELVDEEDRKIGRQRGFSKLGNRIHERTHSMEEVGKDGRFLDNSPQLQALDKIIRRVPGIRRDDYLDNMSEIYARMMEFRYNHNLDPKRTYTEEEIQRILDQEDKGHNSNLKRYDINTLTRALNEVAQRDYVKNRGLTDYFT